MTVILAANVQSVRIRKTLWIAVCCSHHRSHHLPLANQFPPQLYILGGQPGGMLAGALVSQQLLHRRGDHGEIRTKFFQFIGIAEQRKRAIADEVRSRFLGADHGYNRVGDYFVLRQTFTVDFRVHERTNQSIRTQVLRAHGGPKISRHLFRGLQNFRRAVRIMLEVPQHFREVLRPQLQLMMVFDRHAEHLGANNAR